MNQIKIDRMNMQEEASVINTLLKRNYDAEKGYELAKEDVSNEGLKQFFDQHYKERYRFGHELKEILSELNVKPDKGTTIEADIHRGFMKLKELVSKQNDTAILEECIRGEEIIKDAYEKAVQKENIPTNHKEVLSNHLNSIKKSIDLLEKMNKSLS